MPPEVTFADDELAVTFDRFTLADYDLFLRVKRLPEYRLRFNEPQESYHAAAVANIAKALAAPADRAAAAAGPDLFAETA